MHPLYPRQGYGLAYHYYIDSRLRYVGQTRERSLQWRMTRQQANGHIGYNYSIKRQILNAYRTGKPSPSTFITTTPNRIHLALKTTAAAYASILDKVSAKKVA